MMKFAKKPTFLIKQSLKSMFLRSHSIFGSLRQDISGYI